MVRDDPGGVLLQAYLTASAERDADAFLSRILDELASPLIRRIVASVCRDSAPADADDLVSDTLVDLLRRLRDIRERRAEPILNLRAYIVTCAYNCCHERLRVRYPARNRLRNHLQYLFGHRDELALWRATNGMMVCGLREWTGRPAAPAEEAKRLSLVARSDSTAENRAQINGLAAAALQQLGKPLELETLLAAIAGAIQLQEQRFDPDVTPTLAASLPRADRGLELRVSLRQLWQDIAELSPNQRAALLLNLRDAHGCEVVSLLPDTGTASIAEIAETVGIPLERFSELWSALPLSDAAIGELLGASARQVIKLRRLARERLRRMGDRRESMAADRGRERDTSPASDVHSRLPANKR